MKKKNFFALVSGTAGILLFGIGMCMCMLWGMLLPGTLIGIVGILLLLLLLIPLCRGFVKEEAGHEQH